MRQMRFVPLWSVVVGLVLAFAASAGAAVVPCHAAPKGKCGQVLVPLDRSNPGGATVGISFVVFKHTDASKPAAGTIFVTAGGPGYSAINNTQAQYRQLFGPLLSSRDLVLIDQRGVGQSSAIDCEPLQKENTEIYSAVARCGRQLGAASDLYGSADVARDVDAVRAALGIEKFDYYGGSFAAMDIQAYAARFPGHLRSVVLDSPTVLSVEGPWFAAEAAQSVSAVRLVCGRSASCSARNHHPVADLRWLIHRLRSKPVKGIGRDATGAKHHLTVTEGRLARLLQSDAGGYVVQGEIAAAAKALRHRDSAPLLRLAAENDFPLFHGDPSDPTLFSVGDNIARFCTDQSFQWDKQASLEKRRTQFDAARATLAPNTFSPFSVGAWVQPAPLGFLPDPCIGWPAPTHSGEAPVPAGTVTPGVPALILTGDLDLSVPPAESAQASKQFPQSTIVELAGSGHGTAFNARFMCAGTIINHFLDQLNAGDTRCAKKPKQAFPGVGSFPHRAGHSPARIARTATATILDVLKRGFLGAAPRGVGLRGGTFTTKQSHSGLSVRLEGVRFAEDLPVSGKAVYTGFRKLDATLSVPGGTIRVRGVWGSEGATRLKVTGKLHGQIIALSVPAT